MKYLGLLLLYLSYLNPLQAQTLSGKITNQDNEPIEFANIFIKNTTYGTVSNLKGNYSISLKNGDYQVIFQILGYKEQIIDVKINNNSEIINVKLIENSVETGAVEISSKKENIGLKVIKKAQAEREKYLNPFDFFQCHIYHKTSLEEEKFKSSKDTNKKNEKMKLNFKEVYSELYFYKPNIYKEKNIATLDFSDKKSSQSGVSIDVNNSSTKAGKGDLVEAYVYQPNYNEGNINLYENLINLNQLCDIPLVSPIGRMALLTYDYKLIESFYVNNKKIYKIQVTPKNENGAAFSGIIFINDETYTIQSFSFSINKSALRFYKSFQIIQDYLYYNDKPYISRQEMNYYLKEVDRHIYGTSSFEYSNYQFNEVVKTDFKRNEIIKYNSDAYDKSLGWWDSIRPKPLKTNEIEYIHKEDSIKKYKLSDTYLNQKDSIFNNFNLISFLFSGWGYQNHKKGIFFTVGPQIMAMKFLMPGGYRHGIDLDFRKIFKNEHMFKNDFNLHYGFRNKNVLGYLNSSYMYNPFNFSEIGFGVEKNYVMVNANETVSSIFSPNNYSLRKGASIFYRREFFNGFYAKTKIGYATVNSIVDIEQPKWAMNLFGKFATPVDFQPIIEAVLTVNLELTPFQKFMTLPKKKLILGSKYPTLYLNYTRAVKGINNSNVQFEQIEFKTSHTQKIGTIGESKFQIVAGSFLLTSENNFTNNKFFARTDPIFFYNPLTNFQFLENTYHTNKTYLEFHYLHNFNQLLLNRMPIIKKFKLQSLAGTSILALQSEKYAYSEWFAGVAMPFRIRGQIMRGGIYYIAATDNTSGLRSGFKIGFSIFDVWDQKWTY